MNSNQIRPILSIVLGLFLLMGCDDADLALKTKPSPHKVNIKLPTEPNMYNANNHLSIEEICLNGFVYYIGHSVKKTIMAPKYIESMPQPSVERCIDEKI